MQKPMSKQAVAKKEGVGFMVGMNEKGARVLLPANGNRLAAEPRG
jgi:hypothetical protein